MVEHRIFKKDTIDLKINERIKITYDVEDEIDYHVCSGIIEYIDNIKIIIYDKITKLKETYLISDILCGYLHYEIINDNTF